MNDLATDTGVDLDEGRDAIGTCSCLVKTFQEASSNSTARAIIVHVFIYGWLDGTKATVIQWDGM